MTRRLSEVADKAGVSQATVSRVLNGRGGVSEATRTAVLTALDVLGYERPTMLRGERARLVGLFLPELQNPIFPAFAAARLVERGATGLTCASDVLALGAIRAIRRLGLRVPQDVSVIGYDDSAFMNCTDPPLTTVRQPIEAMGHAAVELLVNQMERVDGAPEELFFEPELVLRGSTAAAPTR